MPSPTRSRTQALSIRILVLALTVLAASPLAAQRRTAEPFAWSGTVRPGGSMEIKGVNGPITVVATAGSATTVRATRTGRDDDPSEVRIELLEHAGGVTVCAVYPSSGNRVNECQPGDGGRISANNNDVVVAFTVEMPATTPLVARTTNGDVRVGALQSNVEVSSTNGDVTVDAANDVAARTTNGSIRLTANGYATARSTNGAIDAVLTRMDPGADRLAFTTTNGAITLTLPDQTNARIDATTSNGGIVSDVPVTVQGRFGRNRLEGSIGAGGSGPLIELTTTNGSIHLERGS